MPDHQPDTGREPLMGTPRKNSRPRAHGLPNGIALYGDAPYSQWRSLIHCVVYVQSPSRNPESRDTEEQL